MGQASQTGSKSNSARTAMMIHKEGGAQRIEPTERQLVTASFKPGYHFYMAFSSLALLAMMASLDGTSIAVALPVRPLLPFFEFHSTRHSVHTRCVTPSSSFYTSLTVVRREF